MSIKPDTGQLLIYGSLCKEDERIVGARLVQLENWDSREGETLWEISSAEGTRELVFIVGEVPESFQVVQPLASLPPGDAYVRAQVEIATTKDQFWVDEVYRLSRLRPSLVRAHSELIPPDEWDTWVSDMCDPGGLFGR